MTIYIILLIVIMILAVIMSFLNSKSTKNQKIKRIVFILIIFCILFSVMALRGKSVGVDNNLYCIIFNSITNGNMTEQFDTSMGYVYYNQLVSFLLGDNTRNIIIANAFVVTLLFVIFVTKSSPNIYVSTVLYLLLYFYLQSFNITRQFIAILLCAIAMKYAIDRKWKMYIILSVCAISIHNTAIFMAIVGIILGLIKQYNIKKIMIIWAIALVSGLFLTPAIKIFITLFPKYISYFTTNNIFGETGSGGKILLIIAYLCFTILGLYVLLKRKNKNEDISEDLCNDRKYMIYTTLIGLACIVGFEGAFVSLLISRVSLYFEVFTIIYIPMVIERINRRKEVWYLMTYIIFFISFCAMLLKNISGVVPYVLY